MDKKHSAWDKNVPIEKSSYIVDSEIHLLNNDVKKITTKKPTMLDLFCGAGGFSVGAEWSGFRTVAGIDHFEPAMKTWAYNHPKAIGFLGDIKKIDPDYVKNILKQKGVDHINLITGGVPCQGFSRANRKHRDDDERNFLFLEYMRYVEVFQPDFIILENVSGMRSTAGGKFESDIKSAMEQLGYCVTVKLVNAADFGVPQIRQRLIFVGAKNPNNKYKFPDPTVQNGYRTVYDAISDLPALHNKETKDRYQSSPLTGYQRKMRLGSDVIFNHTAPNHPEATIEKIKTTKPGEPMYESFKQRIRLSMDKPSPTQLAGGIRPQFQFGHPTQSRGLSIRERARIQSFPDSYRFFGGIVQERVLTGNAVPPLLIHELTKSIVKILKR